MSNLKKILVVLLSLLLFLVYLLEFLKPTDVPGKSMVYLIPTAILIVFLLTLDDERLASLRYAGLIFAGFSLVFMSPFLVNIGNWGTFDFDQYLTYNLLEYNALSSGEMPFWNSFMCGGQPLLSNPQSTALTPTFLFILAFGPIAGTKVNMIFHLFAGMIGCFLVARQLKIEGIASYVPSFVYMMSGVYAANIAVGHYIFITIAWIPYVFLFFLKSLENMRYVPLMSVFLSLMLFEGYPYTLAYTVLFVGLYSVLLTAGDYLKTKSVDLKPLLAVVAAVALFVVLSSAKLFPMMEFIMQNPRFMPLGNEGYTSELLYHGLLSTDQSMQRFYIFRGSAFNQFGNMYSPWHEYSAYIGELFLLLVVLGLVLNYRNHLPLILCLVFFVWASFSLYAPINLWAVIRQLPLLNNIGAPTRMKIIFMFIASIFAGYGSAEASKHKKIFAVLVSIALINVVTVNMNNFYYSFVVPPINANVEGGFSQIVYDVGELAAEQPQSNVMASVMYPFIKAGKGVKNCFEPIAMKEQNTLAEGEEGYSGEAYVTGEGDVFLKDVKANSFVVKAEVNGPNRLVLNQNYFNGWMVDGRPAEEYDGLVSAAIEGSGTYKFTYEPSNFWLYLILSVVGLVVSAVVYFRK